MGLKPTLAHNFVEKKGHTEYLKAAEQVVSVCGDVFYLETKMDDPLSNDLIFEQRRVL